MKNQSLKIFFGLIIFLFSVALAYFTANYVSSSGYFDYWATLAIFGAAYVLIGIAVSMIFSISLGFLFAADVVILHLLGGHPQAHSCWCCACDSLCLRRCLSWR